MVNCLLRKRKDPIGGHRIPQANSKRKDEQMRSRDSSNFSNEKPTNFFINNAIDEVAWAHATHAYPDDTEEHAEQRTNVHALAKRTIQDNLHTYMNLSDIHDEFPHPIDRTIHSAVLSLYHGGRMEDMGMSGKEKQDWVSHIIRHTDRAFPGPYHHLETGKMGFHESVNVRKKAILECILNIIR